MQSLNKLSRYALSTADYLTGVDTIVDRVRHYQASGQNFWRYERIGDTMVVGLGVAPIILEVFGIRAMVEGDPMSLALLVNAEILRYFDATIQDKGKKTLDQYLENLNYILDASAVIQDNNPSDDLGKNMEIVESHTQIVAGLVQENCYYTAFQFIEENHDNMVSDLEILVAKIDEHFYGN